MTTKVEKSIVVGVPISTAYNQWTQFEEFPRFITALDEVRQLGDDRLLWVARIAGVQRQWEARILDQVPDQKVAWAATEGVTNAGEVTFADAGTGNTRVTVLLEYEPEGFVESVGDTLGIVGREVERSLERFKTFIESRGHETGEWRGSIHEGSGVGRPTVADAAGSRGDSGKVEQHTAGRGGEARYDLEDPNRDAPRSTVDASAPTGPAPVADPAGTYVAGAGVRTSVNDPARDRVESGLSGEGQTVPGGGLREEDAWPAEHRAQSGLSSPGETVPEGGLSASEAEVVEHRAETGLSSPGATVPGGGLNPEDAWVVEHPVESGLSSPGPTVEPEPTRDDDRVTIDPEGNTRFTGDTHSPQDGPEVDDPGNPKGKGTGRPLI